MKLVESFLAHCGLCLRLEGTPDKDEERANQMLRVELELPEAVYTTLITMLMEHLRSIDSR